MKALTINFAPASWYRRLHHIGPITWVLLALALLWVAALLWQQRQWHLHILAQEAQMQTLHAKLQARDNVKPLILKTTVTEPKARAVNLAIGKLNLPWHDLLDALEAATPSSIALLALEPDAKLRLLRASAEAKDSKEMANYLKNLRIAGFFESVLLTRHEINEQDPNRPIRFQFEARWLIGFDTRPEQKVDELLEQKLENSPQAEQLGKAQGASHE